MAEFCWNNIFIFITLTNCLLFHMFSSFLYLCTYTTKMSKPWNDILWQRIWEAPRKFTWRLGQCLANVYKNHLLNLPPNTHTTSVWTFHRASKKPLPTMGMWCFPGSKFYQVPFRAVTCNHIIYGKQLYHTNAISLQLTHLDGMWWYFIWPAYSNYRFVQYIIEKKNYL